MASIYKTWADGDAFTAADANTYFMRQAIIACDDQTARDAILTPQEGMTVWRKDLDAFQTYDGSAWFTNYLKWQSYTPTLSNMTLGNGTLACKYVQIGKTVICSVKFTLGTTSAMGTGPSLTLPVTGHSDTLVGGSGSAVDTGNFAYPLALGASTTSLVPLILNSAGTYVVNAHITATAPFTWGSTDVLSALFTYQAA